MGGIVMKSEYIQPVIEILLFDEDEILTASAVTTDTTTEGVTANEDVLAQMNAVLGGSTSSITSIRLEDISVTSN
jgi:hypothetical protein